MLEGRSKMGGGGGSIDKKTLGQNVLDGSKYIGKNFWKVLPVGSKLNHINKDKHKVGTFMYEVKSFFHDIYALAGIVTLGGYLTFGAMTGAWTPRQINEYELKKRVDEAFIEISPKYAKDKFDKIAGKKHPKNLQDSLNICDKYELPVKILNLTDTQKTEIINSIEWLK